MSGTVVGEVLAIANSPYPPSFDNNPVIFGWALFARLVVMMLSAATIVRIHARNKADGITANHPVFYHRATVLCFLWAALIGSSSDVLTYLFWGEADRAMTAVVLLLSRVFDALTLFPMLMALFVPIWTGWLKGWGVLKVAPSIMLNGIINDVRATWPDASIPLKLLVYSAVGSALITVGKYLLWLEHVRT